MTTKKQTLADYLQRQEVLRNANRYQGLSENQRERIQYFDAKKKRVGVLLNDILYQVKKAVQNEENYSKLEKMIKAAADEIKTEFENTNKFTQQKIKSVIPQMDTQQDLSIISLNSKVLLNEGEPKVLKELNKVNNIPAKQQVDRAKGRGKQYSHIKENLKVTDVKSRSSLPQGK